MKRVLHCDCGFEVHADDEAELVRRVQRHAMGAHGMRLSPEDVLQLALRAELREGRGESGLGAGPMTTPRGT
jgi:predicted small metal-binding protein